MNEGNILAVQQLIGAAVTPVVMIAACATLVLGINTKHNSISDRLRSFAAECRTDLTPARRQQILGEIRVFHRRYLFTYTAHVLLNAAIIAFILTVPVILFTEHHLVATNRPTLTLFLTGVTLMLISMICELIEISLSMASIKIELSDVEKP